MLRAIYKPYVLVKILHFSELNGRLIIYWKKLIIQENADVTS